MLNKSLLPIIILIISLNTSILAQFAQQPPFKLTIEPITSTMGVTSYHSFAFASSGSKWLIIGGRTNGLHGLNANDPFPTEFANNTVTVIDTANWQSYQSSLSNLPYSVADPLRSANMQSVQLGNDLYIIGGYGRDSIINKFVTFPVVTKIDVNSMISAVIGNNSLAGTIKQVSDTNLRVCGGELLYYDNQFYLVFGHDFNGRYANPFVPIYTQVYTNSIKKFNIVENAGNLQITNYSTLIDTNNFHRRDLNVFPMINPNGTEALMAFAGVFQKQIDYPYFEPIYIDNNSTSVINYTQVMSHYTCAALPIYDSVSKNMHTVFFGGLSFNDYDPLQNMVFQDSLVPFISDITCFTVKPGLQCQEAILPNQLSGLLGTNARFVPNTNASYYPNGVLNLNSVSTKTLAGYMFGGIRADLPNLGNVSVPNDTVYRIYIEPDSSVSINEPNSAFNFLNVFPNPATSKLIIRFKLKKDEQWKFELLSVNGKKLKEIPAYEYKKSDVSLQLDVENLPSGVYLLQGTGNDKVLTRKVIIQH